MGGPREWAVVGKLGCYLDNFEGLRFLFTSTPYLNISKRYPNS